MKTISVLFFIAILFAGFIIPKDSNKILWSKDYQLQWKDFAGPVKQMDGMDAYTSYTIENNNDSGKFSIKCYFDRKKSWRIKKKETDYLLSHEQYHFNIAELYTRKMRKEVIENKIKFGSKEYNKTFKNIFNDCTKAQKDYDKNTKHSMNKEEQAKWEKDVDTQIQELNEFSNPYID